MEYFGAFEFRTTGGSNDSQSSEISSRKCAPRTGLQVLLEELRSCRVGELDRRHELPRSATGGVPREPRIVRCESRLNVGCQSGVVPVLVDRADKNIDVSLIVHASARCKPNAEMLPPVLASRIGPSRKESAELTWRLKTTQRRFCYLKHLGGRGQPKLVASGAVRLRAHESSSAAADSLRASKRARLTMAKPAGAASAASV